MMVKFKNWINALDRPWQLIGTVATTVAVFGIIDWLTGSGLYDRMLYPKLTTTPEVQVWSALVYAAAFILGLPIAFLLWHWRDRNVRDQIENARKDINLKEFQELQLRAAGAITTNIPEKSRQTLWISALHQMRGYLRGEYGESFKRPSFEVYCALLERQKRSEKVENPTESKPEPDLGLPDSVYRTVRDIVYEEWQAFFWEDFYRKVGWPLKGRSFRRLRLPSGSWLNGLDFSRTDFSESELRSVNFGGARLSEAKFEDCVLQSAILMNSECRGANFNGADLANLTANGASFSEGMFKSTKFDGSNLEGANFFKSSGSRCSFVNVNLNSTNFDGCSLSDCNFENSQMVGAKFVSAQLYSTRMSGVDATESDFSYAIVWGVFPQELKSLHGLKINRETCFTHWNKDSWDTLSESEALEVQEHWKAAGAVIVNVT